MEVEAPDNIYLFKKPNDVILGTWFLDPCELFENIEYTRTDVFIKRIYELLSSRIDYITYYHDKTEFVNEIIKDISKDLE